MAHPGMLILTFYPAAMFVCGVAAAVIAKNKRRDEVIWGIFCFLLPALLIVLLLLPRGNRPHGRHPFDDEGKLDDYLW